MSNTFSVFLVSEYEKIIPSKYPFQQILCAYSCGVEHCSREFLNAECTYFLIRITFYEKIWVQTKTLAFLF